MTRADNHPPRGGDGSASLLRRSLLLLVVLLLCQVVLGAVAYTRDGRAGLEASFTALLACLLGGWAALAFCDFLGWLLTREVVAFAQAVFGMLIRAGVGLAVCAVAYLMELPPARHGPVFYVLAFYMVTLAVETVFAVRQFSEMDYS